MPTQGTWGCENADANGQYAGEIATSSGGVVRVALTGFDAAVLPADGNNFIYVSPSEDSFDQAIDALEFGDNVVSWICQAGSADVAAVMPGTCANIASDATIAFDYAN